MSDGSHCHLHDAGYLFAAGSTLIAQEKLPRRVAEQRAGRVNRMDSPHDEVTIWWPRDSEAFAPRGRDIFRERHEAVRDLLGANLQLPDEQPTEPERSLRPEELVEVLQAQSDAQTKEEEYFDAFRDVRGLVEGGDSLVRSKTYEEMRQTQAEIVACVSVLESEAPWCFLAVGGLDRAAPRWVYFESLDAPPEFDLVTIPEKLRLRLGAKPEPREPDEQSRELLEQFLRRLEACEGRFDLLPVRKRSALELLRHHLRGGPLGLFDAHEANERRELEAWLFPTDRDGPYPEPASVADAWLGLLRPRIEKVLKNRRLGKPWRLADLRDSPELEEIDAGQLRKAFDNIPLLRPVEERIVALILGVTDASAPLPFATRFAEDLPW